MTVCHKKPYFAAKQVKNVLSANLYTYNEYLLFMVIETYQIQTHSGWNIRAHEQKLPTLIYDHELW